MWLMSGMVSEVSLDFFFGLDKLICISKLLNRKLFNDLECFVKYCLKFFLFWFCMKVLGFLLFGKKINLSWWLLYKYGKVFLKVC